MKNFKKSLAGIAAAAFCFGLGYALPAAADSTNTQIQINNNLRRTHISSEEYAFSGPDGTCLMVEHENGSKIYKITYEPGVIEAGTLPNIWQNYKIGRDPINNAAYLSYSLLYTESAALQEMARKAYFVLVDVANGVNPPTQVEKYRAYGIVKGFDLLFAEATTTSGDGVDVTSFAGEKWIKGTEVRMRAKPNTDCEVLGYFDEHENVRVLGYVNGEGNPGHPGNWAYVRKDNGVEGFVAAQFVASGPAVENFEQHLIDHINNSGKYNNWRNIDYVLETRETYCGEGPRAVATKVLEVYENRGGQKVLLAAFHVSDNGHIGKEVNGYIVRDN